MSARLGVITLKELPGTVLYQRFYFINCFYVASFRLKL